MTSIIATQILREYYEHLSEHSDSLLCRILALFRAGPKNRYMLIMSNVLDSDRKMHAVSADVFYICMHVCTCIYTYVMDSERKMHAVSADVFMFACMYVHVCVCNGQ